MCTKPIVAGLPAAASTGKSGGRRRRAVEFFADGLPQFFEGVGFA
jgi:hypothetical protein